MNLLEDDAIAIDALVQVALALAMRRAARGATLTERLPHRV